MTCEEKLKVKYAETKTQDNTDSVADLEVNSDQAEEIQAGAETKSGSGGAIVGSFLAFPGFTGGVRVAAGDVD